MKIESKPFVFFPYVSVQKMYFTNEEAKIFELINQNNKFKNLLKKILRI